MAKVISKWLLIIRLSFADLWYDKKVSFCIIASVISVITPLLLLFSLKYGVVSQLRQQLLNKKVSFCIIASVISVITPLLLLFSLKYGVVSQLREQLLNDPRYYTIIIII
jgi:hypothetical protein